MRSKLLHIAAALLFLAALPRVVSAFPLTRTAGDYTLTLTKAQWAVPDQWRYWNNQRGLMIFFKLTMRDGSPVTYPNDRTQYLKARVYKPLHIDISPSCSFNGDSMFSYIDPHGGEYKADFVLSDPAANPEDTGRSDGLAVFHNVAWPAGDDQTQTVNRQYVTDLGTVVELQSVQTESANGGRTTFTWRVTPSTSVPGLAVSAGAPVKVKFADGADWAIGGQTLEDTRAFTLIETIKGLPPSRRAADITVPISEDSLSLRDPAHYMHFGFRIPARSIAMTPADPPITTLSTSVTGPLVIGIDTFRHWSAQQYRIGVWITDTHSPPLDWKVNTCDAYSSAGDRIGAGMNQPQYWREDGRMASPQTTCAIAWTWNNAAPPLVPSSLKMTLQGRTRSEAELSFANVPIPAKGDTTTIHQKPDDDPNSYVTLESVSNTVAPANQTILDHLRELMKATSISQPAIVCTFHVDKGFENNLAIYGTQALDENGLCLLPSPSGLVTGQTIDACTFTLTFNPPSAHASDMTIGIHLVRLVPEPGTITATVDLPK